MRAALYKPGLGYYTRRPSDPAATPLASADYQTSPQVHPIFGRVVARELKQIWEALDRPDPFVVVEPGAGAGELARSILDGLADIAPELRVDYYLVDPRFEGADLTPLPPFPCAGRGESRRTILSHGLPERMPMAQDRSATPPLPAHGKGGRGVRSAPSLSSLLQAGVSAHCVVSNEFFDALPVHRLVWTDGALREVYVDWGASGFVEWLGPLSDPALGAWIDAGRAEPEEGWRGEVCLELEEVFAVLERLVPRGVVLTFDYGYPAADPRRGVDTLLAYHRHHASADVYERVGTRDLTCHVDLGALLRVGARHGFAPVDIRSQRDFLLGLGLKGELERLVLTEPSPARQWQARLAAAELVKAKGLGKLSVVTQKRGEFSYE